MIVMKVNEKEFSSGLLEQLVSSLKVSQQQQQGAEKLCNFVPLSFSLSSTLHLGEVFTTAQVLPVIVLRPPSPLLFTCFHVDDEITDVTSSLLFVLLLAIIGISLFSNVNIKTNIINSQLLRESEGDNDWQCCY